MIKLICTTLLGISLNVSSRWEHVMLVGQFFQQTLGKAVTHVIVHCNGCMHAVYALYDFECLSL